MKRRFIFAAVSAVLLSFLIFSAEVFAGARDGAVNLPNEDIYRGKNKTGVVICGRINGTWLSGSLSGGKFLSHAQYISNLEQIVATQNGRKRLSTYKTIRTVRTKLNRDNKICTPKNGNNNSGTDKKVRFKSMRGAYGLAVKNITSSSSQTASTSGTNLFIVNQDGSLTPIFEDSNIVFSRVLIAPSNKIYVLFQYRVSLDTGEMDFNNGCLLAEVSVDGGQATCVDSTVGSILWPQWGINQYRNEPIQFDSEGAIYYWARNLNGNTLFKRYLNGTSEDLITDNVSLIDYLVRPNGTVFITGTTNTTSSSWLRYLRADRSLRTINDTTASFLKMFPDGNLYFGTAQFSFFGVKRFLVGSETVDPKPWIARWFQDYQLSNEPYNNTANIDFCSNYNHPAAIFCSTNGAFVSSIERTTNGNVYAVAALGSSRSLIKYAPQVEYVNSVIKSPTLLKALVNNLFIAGTDEDYSSRLVLYNTDDQSEIDLLNGNQIEIYRMGVSGQKLLFDGLNFANNKYVIGSVDLQTLELVYSSTGDTRLVDFQTFIQ